MTSRRWLAAVLGATLVVLVAAAGSAEEPEEKKAPTVHTVLIKAMKFVPEVIEVSAGDEIVWVNEDIVPHTVTATDKSPDSGLINTKASWKWVPDETGEHPYVCLYHPTMTGKVIVK